MYGGGLSKLWWLFSYLQCSKVYHTVNVGMRIENLVKVLLLSYVDNVELGSLATDEFDAIDDFLGRVVKIVSDHNLIVGFEQGEGRKGAYVARPTVQVSALLRSIESFVLYPVTSTEPTVISAIEV